MSDTRSDGVINREEFDPRIERARTQLAQREEALAQTHAEAAEREALKDNLQCLETFASQIEGGLADADWNTRREILRTAIDHIQVEAAQIRITYRINFPLFLNRKKSSKSLLFRWRRSFTNPFERVSALRAGPLVRTGREAAHASAGLPHPLCG